MSGTQNNRIYGLSQDETVSVAGAASITVDTGTTVLVIRETNASTTSLLINLPVAYQSDEGRLLRVLRTSPQATSVSFLDSDGGAVETLGSAGSTKNIEVHLVAENGGVGTWEVSTPTTAHVDEHKPLNVIVLNYDDTGRHQMPTYSDLNSWPAGEYHLYPQMPWTQDRSGTISDQGTEAGTRFVNGRVAARCTPTRQCLATGRQPHLSQAHPWGTQVGNIPQQGSVNPDFRSITGVIREQNPFPVVAKKAGAPHYFFHIGKVHASEWELRDEKSDYVTTDDFGDVNYNAADENRRNYKQILADYGFDEAYKLELGKPDGAELEPYKGYKGSWHGEDSDGATQDAKTFSAYHMYSDPAQGASGWTVDSGAKVGVKTLPVTGGTGTFKRGDKLVITGLAQPVIVWEDSGASPTEITLYEPLRELPKEGASITVTFHIVGDGIVDAEEYGGGELGGMRRSGFDISEDPGQAGATLILETGGSLTSRPDILTSSITASGTGTDVSADYGEDPYYLTYELTKIKECIEACADRGKPFYIQWWTNAPHGSLPAIESNLGPAWSRTGVASDGTTYFFTDAQFSGGVSPGAAIATGWHREEGTTDTLHGGFTDQEVKDMCKRYLRTFKDEVVDGIDVSDAQHPLIQQGIYCTKSYDGQVKDSGNVWANDTRFTVGASNTPGDEPNNFGPGYNSTGSFTGSGDYGPHGQISVSFRRMIAQMESLDRGCQMLDDWLQLNYPEVHANTLWVIHSDNGPTESDSTPRTDQWQVTGKAPAHWTQQKTDGTTANPSLDWTDYELLPPYDGGTLALTSSSVSGYTEGVDNPALTFHDPAHSKNRVNDDGLLTHLSVWGYGIHEGGNDTDCFTDACDFYKTVLDLISPGCWNVALEGRDLHYTSDSDSFAPALVDTSHNTKDFTLHQIYTPTGAFEGELNTLERCLIDTTSNYKLLRRIDASVEVKFNKNFSHYKNVDGAVQVRASATGSIGEVADGEKVLLLEEEGHTGSSMWNTALSNGQKIAFVKLIKSGSDAEQAVLELYNDRELTSGFQVTGYTTATTFTAIAGGFNFDFARDPVYTQDEEVTGWYLYDLTTDPREKTNLYGEPGYDSVVSQLRSEYLKKFGNLD